MVNDRTSRIMRIMEEEKMNATQFAETIGIQRAAMSHILNGRNNPSVDVISKIIDRFDTINPGWLLNGKGPMHVAAQSINSSENYGNRHDGNEIDFTTEATLFDEMYRAPKTGSESSADRVSSESRMRTTRETIKSMQKETDNTEKEVFVYKDRQTKMVDKILIFYSDHTYETFARVAHED
jgi:DNA-binding XRE family transcriptional regulator